MRDVIFINPRFQVGRRKIKRLRIAGDGPDQVQFIQTAQGYNAEKTDGKKEIFFLVEQPGYQHIIGKIYKKGNIYDFDQRDLNGHGGCPVILETEVVPYQPGEEP